MLPSKRLWVTRAEYKRLTEVDSVPELPFGPHGQNTPPACGNLETLQVEVPKLRMMIEELLQEGRLRPGIKLTIELLAFADRVEGRLAAMRASPITPPDDGVKENKSRLVIERLYGMRPGMQSMPNRGHVVGFILSMHRLQSKVNSPV